MWKDWRGALIVVHPDTVVRWQRERFRRYWRRLSDGSHRTGRPPIPHDIRELIRTLAFANANWRAPRIHGELQKARHYGFRTDRLAHPANDETATFADVENLPAESFAIDFFTVPNIRLRVLFVFLVMEHQRRRVLHFGVTEHPTAERDLNATCHGRLPRGIPYTL